jgi:phage terminase small subunit
MELTMDIKFEQLVEIISQLPEDLKEKLIESVNQKEKTKKSTSKEDFQKLILKAPTWTDEQIEAYQNARKHINLSRIT